MNRIMPVAKVRRSSAEGTRACSPCEHDDGAPSNPKVTLERESTDGCRRTDAENRITEGVKHKHLSAVITFIDFCKAFDTIHRVNMMNILTAYRIPNKLVQVIGAAYASTRARVTSPDGVTEFFDILAGVLQGDTLAPLTTP